MKYFVEVTDGCDLHSGYVVSTLDKVKDVLIHIIQNIYDEEMEWGTDNVCLSIDEISIACPTDLFQWLPVIDAVKLANSLESIKELLYDFEETSGYNFQLLSFEEGKELKLMD